MVHHPSREQAVVVCRHACAAGVQLRGKQGGERGGKGGAGPVGCGRRRATERLPPRLHRVCGVQGERCSSKWASSRQPSDASNLPAHPPTSLLACASVAFSPSVRYPLCMGMRRARRLAKPAKGTQRRCRAQLVKRAGWREQAREHAAGQGQQTKPAWSRGRGVAWVQPTTRQRGPYIGKPTKKSMPPRLHPPVADKPDARPHAHLS